MLRRCCRCGIVKWLSEFRRHRANVGGHVPWCKGCTQPDKPLTARGQMQERAYASLPQARQLHTAAAMRYQRAYPERTAANKALRYAVRTGRVNKPDRCSECGLEGKTHGHHDDYRKPLEVVWLCARCHRARGTSIYAFVAAGRQTLCHLWISATEKPSFCE